MATKGYIDTRGMGEWLEQIAALGENVDQAAAEAVDAGADVLKIGMRRRVAKDTHNLEEHIDKTGPEQDGNFVYEEVGLLSEGLDAETARYGNAQEYGTSSMQAHPYVRPTIAEDKGKARKAMIGRLKQFLETRS